MKTLSLYLDGTTPDKLSLKRLTLYLHQLSVLYGHEEAVHFDAVKPGSAQLLSKVEEQAFPKVVIRIKEVNAGLGGSRLNAAFKKLSDLMLEDRVDGSLRAEGAQIIQFPKGKLIEPPLRVIKSSNIQGWLYSIGGRDEFIPVKVEGADGEMMSCEAPKSIAVDLAHLLFKQVRLNGEGEWERRPDGSWRLLKLRIDSFKELKDIGLKAAIAQLKATGGIKWNDMPAPHTEILESRG
jgi:hypothetical protein